MINPKELTSIREAGKGMVALRVPGGVSPGGNRQIMVCGGTGCIASGSYSFTDALDAELVKQGLTDKVKVVKTGCFGLCAQGPIVIVYPEGTFYRRVKAEDVADIVKTHLVENGRVERLLYQETEDSPTIELLGDTPFYAKQSRVALRNCGRIDPTNINEYIAYDGYRALGKVLDGMSQQEVVDTLKAAGLRGRGGAGFPTGNKWAFALAAQSDQKYVVCNADEGDPGAFMDRSILEGDPHAVIEAMAIAGYAIGANQGYVYVRAEYPTAVERLRIAIGQANERGLLGDNIMNTGFNFHLDLRLGAGAFVCGEETALLTSIEGHRGEPRPRPPFPAVKGLFGKPTIINNVETLANIPQIIDKGADWFAAMGTEKSKGTKVFALGGKIRHTGLVEVPMGTTLKEVVEDIGGGIPNGRKFKAAQTGGPSGGCIPLEHYDIAIDYDNLITIGSMMGSGGMIVMDEDNCMVDIAKFFLEFTVEESCGKCVPCRIGTKRLYEILDKITKGQATMEDLNKMETLCYHIKDNSLCGLGQTAPNPVLSTLKYFRDEYLAHINEKRCPAGVCKDLLAYTINPEKCIGCTLCARVCPVNAISGSVKNPHSINLDLCIKCGACLEKCKFGAITKG